MATFLTLNLTPREFGACHAALIHTRNLVLERTSSEDPHAQFLRTLIDKLERTWNEPGPVVSRETSDASVSRETLPVEAGTIRNEWDWNVPEESSDEYDENRRIYVIQDVVDAIAELATPFTVRIRQFNTNHTTEDDNA